MRVPSWLLLATLAACGGEPARTSSSGTGTGGSGGTLVTTGGGEPGCAPGEVSVDEACVAAGVPPQKCPAGFVPDDGGCTPILPEGPCPDGLMALPGDAACRPIMDCGEGPWGDIPVDATTQYVDQSYAGMDSDGTAARPWTTIQDAIDPSPDGTIVAIAAGSYPESPVTYGRALQIWGRCPAMVDVTGESNFVTFSIDGDGLELHGMSLSSGSSAVFAFDVQDVSLDRVRIHDTGDLAVFVASLDTPAVLAIADSVIERATGVGIVASGATVVLNRSVIRGTVAGLGLPGRGIDAEYDSIGGWSAHIYADSSVIEENRETGIAVLGSELSLAGSVVRDQEPTAAGRFGIGVAVQRSVEPSLATVVATTISDTHLIGLSVLDSVALVTDSTIDTVDPQPIDGGFGDGIAVLEYVEDAFAEVTTSKIANTSRAGIVNFSGEVWVDSVALSCNPIHLDGESPLEPFTFEDLGGNACWCGDVSETCKVLSTSLEPPLAPP